MLLRWIVGLARSSSTPRKHRTLLSLEQLETRDVPSGTDLGIAQNYNAFVFTNYNGFNTDTQGKLAVGNNATLTNYGVAQNGPNYTGTDSLVVGHNLSYTNGEVFSGNAAYGNNATLTHVTFANGHAHQQSNVVNFSSAESDLKSKATDWGTTYATNGTISSNWGNLVLTGTNSQLNVFNLTAAQLKNIYSISINAPAGSTVLINVDGQTVNLQYLGISIQGTNASDVLWNFYDATTVNLNGVGIQGSVLAPNAHVNFNNGSIYGTMVADSLSGNGQFNYSQVKIDIVDLPATVSGYVFNDLNGNGVQDPGETGLSGVSVFLSGIQTAGGSYSDSTTTGADGSYSFSNIPPGTYTISAGTPSSGTWAVVSIHVGSQGGTASVATGEILGVVLKKAANGTQNNFGEQQNTGTGGHD